MKKELTKEQRITQIQTEIVNFDNCGKVLMAEKNIIKKFINHRKPVLNREGKDIMAPQLNMIGMSFVTVIKHLDERITELKKALSNEEEIK